ALPTSTLFPYTPLFRSDLEADEQAVLTQTALGARSARIFVGLALTGHYESAMAVARTLVEDGIACAYLAEHPEKAARWLSGDVRSEEHTSELQSRVDLV